MDKNGEIIIFNNEKIRRVWLEEKELWYFSVIDIIAVLTGSSIPKRYWSDLKSRLKDEGSEVYDKIVPLKIIAPDGKNRESDCANTESLLRLIQSIPSPKVEPFKLWLARVGYERIEEISDPELSINRGLSTYLKKGYSKDWINQRLKSIEIRKALTDEWQNRGIKNKKDFAILTNEIVRAWSKLSVKEYKKFKNLKKENLRDNMTNLELVLNMLAETATTEISKVKEPNDFKKNKKIANEGGKIAGDARQKIEEKINKKVISPYRFNSLDDKK
ncbi:MAG TPA: BRO family protein [bacterium]|nr:BRO family protein [bacterium]HPV65573.1 BRO family protein [bacterium]